MGYTLLNGEGTIPHGVGYTLFHGKSTLPYGVEYTLLNGESIIPHGVGYTLLLLGVPYHMGWGTPYFMVAVFYYMGWIIFYSRVFQTVGPGPKFGPLTDIFGSFKFKIYALNLGLFALSQLMTTIGHKKFESVQLYRDSVLMYSTVCKSLHFRGSVTY